MRILVAHDVNAARTGGMSRIMGFIHDEIAALGHQVEYFCAADVPRPPIHPGLRRFTFPLAVLKHAAANAKRGMAFDIINVHEPSGAAVASLRGGLGGARVVVTSHGVERRGWELRLAMDADPADRPTGKTRYLYPPTLLLQADLALRKADHVFCLNSEDRNYLIKRLYRNPADVTRIFPGANPVFGANANTRSYAEAVNILFAGTWIRRKGIRELSTAFAHIAKNRPDVRLTILNPGVDEFNVLEHFPADCRSRVKCIAAEPEVGTAAAMDSADIFVLPSRFEGTPLTLLEAMWSGLPVVTTAICGMKDVIRDGWNGMLVRPGDAEGLSQVLQRLLDDSELRGQLGRQAHALAKRDYKWADSAIAVLRAYRSLIRAGSEKSPISQDRRTADKMPASRS